MEGNGIAKLDDGGRNIFMSLALEEVKRRVGVLCNTRGRIDSSDALHVCGIKKCVQLYLLCYWK